jgi:hypothetical protein
LYFCRCILSTKNQTGFQIQIQPKYKMRRTLILSLFFSLSLVLMIASCKKEDDFLTDSNAELTFSQNLISFDTIFTTISTSTRQLVVHNPYNQKISIKSIRLANPNSYFSLNVNGEPSNNVSNVEIDAKDSLYIFIKANINATNQNNPLLIADSILFDVNGNIQDVDIIACGQDAHFIVADTHISGLPSYKIVAAEGQHVTWANDKPYVIYGYAVVDSTASLAIASGCKIYMHKNAGMWIYKGGNLKVTGTKTDPVVFQGDRRESWYADVAGQWDRIWINEGSVDNEINYAIIKNGFIGIQAETFDHPMGNKLILTNTVIKNMSGACVLTKRYDVEAANNVIFNAGQYLVALTGGGNCKFYHNTLSNQWAGTTRSTSSVFLSNYIVTSDVIVVSDLQALFVNNIITGNLSEELQLDKNSAANFVVSFDHCLIKTSLNDPSFTGCIRNADPLFKSLTDADFRLMANSPAINAGNASSVPLYPLDILEFSRDGSPDIGAYEYNPASVKHRLR